MLIAAVGLDVARRERAARLLRERFHDRGRPPWSQADLGFVALELEDQGGPALDEYARNIVQAVTRDPPEDLELSWRRHLADVSTRLDPSFAARLLAAAIEQETDPHGRSMAASALATVAGRLAPAEAARICGPVAQTLAIAWVRESETTASNDLVWSLVGVSGRLDRADAAQVLVSALAQRTQGVYDDTLMDGIAAMSARLRPVEAARICGPAARILAGAVMQQTFPPDNFPNRLSKISARFEPREAARLWREVAQQLLSALARQTDAEHCESFASLLAAASAHLDPVEAERTCSRAADTLAAAMERERDPVACARLANAIESVASRMEPGQAARLCGQAGRRLIPGLEHMPSATVFDGTYGPRLDGVSFISSRMDPSASAPMLASAIEHELSAELRHALVLSLMSAAGRLDEAERSRIHRQLAGSLSAALGVETHVGAHPLLAEDLVLVLDRLDEAEAAQLCRRTAEVLAGVLAREAAADARNSVAGALARVSARLGPAEGGRIRGPAARTLVTALDREMDANARRSLAEGLVSLAGIWDQPDRAGALAEAVKRENDNRLRNGLASLAGGADPAGDAPIDVQAARVLATALEHETEWVGRAVSAKGLVFLVDRCDSSEAARIVGPIARSLAGALARDTHETDRRLIAFALASVAGRMVPAEAVHILVAALGQASDPSGLADLVRILSAAFNRLDEAEENRVAEQVLVSLDRDSFTIAPELLKHLHPERAHALAWDLASRMCSGPGPDTGALSRILTANSREQRSRRAARLAIAGPGSEGMLEAWVRVSADPFPCRLTTQELVELLKMPTCFGKARRIVLDHLGNRYHRHFVNHWAFVRFAHAQGLNLDLTTPPKRPEARESVRRTREIRDRSAAGR